MKNISIKILENRIVVRIDDGCISLANNKISKTFYNHVLEKPDPGGIMMVDEESLSEILIENPYSSH